MDASLGFTAYLRAPVGVGHTGHRRKAPTHSPKGFDSVQLQLLCVYNLVTQELPRRSIACHPRVQVQEKHIAPSDLLVKNKCRKRTTKKTQNPQELAII